MPRAAGLGQPDSGRTYNPFVPRSKRLAVRLTTPRVALLAFVFLLIFKWPQWDQPPVWDGSKSVFPAAITLAHTDFDLPHLLRQPSYFDGGPNIHGLSLITWITAAAYWTLGDRPDVILPFLHLLHLMLAAGAVALLWRIAADALDPGLALGTAATIAVFPLFLVQAGYLYLEMPILAFSAAAALSWLRGRTGWAAVWATASALVKSSGTVIAGALVLCTLASAGDWRHKLRRCALLIFGPLAVAATQWALHPSTALGVGSLRATLGFLLSVPDLALILVLFPVAFLVTALTTRPWSTRQIDPEQPSCPRRVQLLCQATFLSFVAFYLALVPLGASVRVLPRYYLQLFPFALIGLVTLVASHSRRAAGGLLFMAALFFLANREGHFYPDPATTNFAITERSMAYVELAQLQDLGLRTVVEAAGETPVFYGLSESYRLSFPEMGHGQTRPANGHCIYFESPYLLARLEDFPPAFFVLYDYPWLGGAEARQVVHQAQSDPRYDVEVATLRVGRFESYLARVERRVTAPPFR